MGHYLNIVIISLAEMGSKTVQINIKTEIIIINVCLQNSQIGNKEEKL